MRWPGVVLAIASGLALSLGPAGAYRTGPPVAHTGGFGEPTCATCHFAGQELPGSVDIEAPDHVEPGADHALRVVLRDPELRSGGFQLSARFAEGARQGEQAGSFGVPAGLAVLEAETGVQYVSHTEAGVRQVSPEDEGRVVWTVRWTAPEVTDAVAFHIAANASNDDDSEFGDRVYLAERVVRARPSEQPK